MHHGGFSDIEQAEIRDEVDSLDDDLPYGVVFDCKSLPVYKRPTQESEVLCELEEGEEIELDLSFHNSRYYAVCTAAGIEGYCSRRFIFL